MHLGNIIKDFREKNNISMQEFADKCSLSKGYISMLENGVNPRNKKPIAPTLPSLRKISIGLGIDTDTLLKMLNENQKITLNSLYIENDTEAEEETLDIMLHYNKLNKLGKETATEHVRLLTLDEKYTKPDNVISMVKEPEPDYLAPNAAHGRTDKEFTEEERLEDDSMLD